MAERSRRPPSLGASTVLPPLLLALIPLSLVLPASDPSATLRGAGEGIPAPARNYVVRFLEYRLAGDHQAYLTLKLGSRSGWRWVERRNPAALFPTDFGVLEIGDSDRASLIAELGRLGQVKDVFVDTSYSRSLLVEERPKGGNFCYLEKRPGKIFTSMSFEEGNGMAYSSVRNASISWRRKLMMQRSQVTSLFGADRLWTKGFTGRKVKMAIFDTGIRADHPHFRNIKERTNWTNEDTLNDNLGHGTFVAGVIAGEDAECLGFAPDTEIYAFRVFTDAQSHCRFLIHLGFLMHLIML
ncbi:subtilisin-like protease SBT6.1 [Canna indica]|uniref:Subtilisin-like protease SBT6.1 n=1 Tax=Canna indica TaxID=4628 RepID=A0AAQ3KSQ0_9LILI|nr:subtilisin-like protease SBT6.1 [Canna indica]